MLPFIYGTRQDIHIINLEQTLSCLRRARDFIHQVARNGGNVLFVGTRPVLHSLVMRLAKQNDAYFCTHWIGGLITNKERVLRRSVGYDPDKVSQSLSAIRAVEEVSDSSNSADAASNSADAASSSVKEGKPSSLYQKQPRVATPDVLVLFDYPNTKWAVHEANIANIPVVAICDTDCDPANVQYPIPANDDALESVQFIGDILGEASKRGTVEWRKTLKRNV